MGAAGATVKCYCWGSSASSRSFDCSASFVRSASFTESSASFDCECVAHDLDSGRWSPASMRGVNVVLVGDGVHTGAYCYG